MKAAILNVMLSAAGSFKTGNGAAAAADVSERFLQMIRAARTADSGLSGKLGGAARGALAAGEGEKDRYLDRLKEVLVKEGRPLSRTFLAKEDLPLLGVFLQRGGFSNDQVQQCMTMLDHRCRDGRLSLSDFFQSAAALKAETSVPAKAAVLDAGSVPHLEGVLRRLGFGAAGISEALGAARVQGGGVDTGLLIQRLRKIAGGSAGDMQGNRLAAAEAAVARLANRNERAGAQIDATTQGAPKGEERSVPIADGLRRAVHPAGAGPAAGGPAPRASAADGLSNPADGTVDQAIRDILQQIQTEAQGMAKSENHIPSARLPLTPSGEGATGLPAAVRPLQGGGESGQPLPNAGVAGPSPGPGPHPSVAHDSSLPGMEAALTGQFAESPDPSFAAAVSRDATPPVFARGPARPADATGAPGERLFAAAPENVVPSHVVNQVGRQLARSLAAGDRVVELRLKPPELGGVKIQMDMQQSGMKLAVVVENQAVRDLLHPHLHELRDLLLGQGVKVDRLDVTIQPQMGQSMSQNEGFQEHQPQPRPHRGSQQGIVTVNDVEEARESTVADTGRRLLDVTA